MKCFDFHEERNNVDYVFKTNKKLRWSDVMLVSYTTDIASIIHTNSACNSSDLTSYVGQFENGSAILKR